jgi:hypothetical protein
MKERDGDKTSMQQHELGTNSSIGRREGSIMVRRRRRGSEGIM